MLRRSDLQFDDAVINASARFRQGSVVRDVNVTFAANVRYCITPAAREQVTERSDTVRVPLPLAIVTSQTCDLQNPKRIAIRPFVSVARVFDARLEFDAGYIGHIKRGRIGDLIPLTAAQFIGADEVWIADLRLEGAIERGVLVGRDALDGFKDDEGYFQFQRLLSAIRARNAIDDRVLNLILKPLRSWLEDNKQHSDLIEEIRIRALPDILTTNSVEIFLLILDEADPADVQDRAK